MPPRLDTQAPYGSRVVLQFEGEFDIYCLDEVCYHWVEVRSAMDLSQSGPRSVCVCV